jgi:hypothetical protein
MDKDQIPEWRRHLVLTAMPPYKKDLWGKILWINFQCHSSMYYVIIIIKL